MKRIAVVTNSLSGGGAERSMNLLCNELFNRNWDVFLVPINKSDQDLVQVMCPIIEINRVWNGSFLNTIFSFIRFNISIFRVRPKALILNCDLPELFGALLLFPVKLIAVEHVNYPWLKRLRFGKVIRFILNLRGVHWVSVSSHLSIWPNASKPEVILLNSITPLVKEQTREIERNHLKRLIFIGRLTEQKRPNWIIELGKATETEVGIYGEGSQEEALRQMAQANSKKVNFFGFNPQVWTYVTRGDLLLVTSGWEGDGLVILEALNNRVPLLLSDIPDLRRFNLPDRNYCTDLRNFVDRIEEFRGNLNDLVVEDDIRRRILDERMPQTVAANWENFLEIN